MLNWCFLLCLSSWQRTFESSWLQIKDIHQFKIEKILTKVHVIVILTKILSQELCRIYDRLIFLCEWFIILNSPSLYFNNSKLLVAQEIACGFREKPYLLSFALNRKLADLQSLLMFPETWTWLVERYYLVNSDLRVNVLPRG